MQARCLCGCIEFEFQPTDGVVMNCYCSICRRSHGAGYVSQIMSSKDSLVFKKGQEFLSEYQSSKYGIRAFCSQCGSRLMNYASMGSRYMSVALTAVSEPHQLKPSANVQVASKAEWVCLAPDIENFDEFPSDIQKYM